MIFFRKPVPTFRDRALAARLSGLLTLAALAACSADLTGYSTIVTQDKFDFMECPQIVGYRAGVVAREKELVVLTEKAESSPGGIIASYSAYRSELAQTRSLMAVVNRAVQKKGCDAPAKK
jgi:hypothetical protein